MRGLQRSPHVTTTMEFPAESTLVSILYLQQPEHPAGGSAHCTGREREGDCTDCTAGPGQSVLHRHHTGPPLESVNSRLSRSKERRERRRYFNRFWEIFSEIDMTATRW